MGRRPKKTADPHSALVKPMRPMKNFDNDDLPFTPQPPLVPKSTPTATTTPPPPTSDDYAEIGRRQCEMLERQLEELSKRPKPAALIEFERNNPNFDSSAHLNRPRSADESEAQKRAREERDIRRELSKHTMVPCGPWFMCRICQQVYTSAGRNRALAERNHARHLDCVRESIIHRDDVPDFFYD